MFWNTLIRIKSKWLMERTMDVLTWCNENEKEGTDCHGSATHSWSGRKLVKPVIGLSFCAMVDCESFNGKRLCSMVESHLESLVSKRCLYPSMKKKAWSAMQLKELPEWENGWFTNFIIMPWKIENSWHVLIKYSEFVIA